jgi:hypothetical protein
MRLCKRCGEKPTPSNKAWYCPECKKIVTKETIDRATEIRKIRRRLKADKIKYHYQKNEGIEEVSPKPKPIAKLSPASKRWASMSWDELAKELDYYHLRYPDAQVMALNNTLPKDFGLKRKKAKKECPQ